MVFLLNRSASAAITNAGIVGPPTPALILVEQQSEIRIPGIAKTASTYQNYQFCYIDF